MEMDKQMIQENDDLHLNLRLGLPGSDDTAKKTSGTKRASSDHQDTSPPPTKTQVIGWPPVRSYRKNILQQKQEEGAMYVKVSMDGAPFLRKIDLKVYNNYPELLEALQNIEGYNGSEHAPTYEDKDGDLMLAGDVPWEMFVTSCKRMRIMKASEAKGL
ncbi:hypothetical protein DCAR_0521117 [Daucus carota subsp. sativus]|uniref:Auxin-responsive protein n=1 Tax=Daucus carota subsp. sativus TaxID=79200 RepID=A0AAF1B2P1_DAUCS|nr:hypothetical protein DCAR_0521117 [Daucus carota subsp. sativus]